MIQTNKKAKQVIIINNSLVSGFHIAPAGALAGGERLLMQFGARMKIGRAVEAGCSETMVGWLPEIGRIVAEGK